MEKNLQKLQRKKRSNKVLVLGHNPLDYKSVLKYPFNYDTKRGFHPPAPTSLMYDNWQDFKGDIITCHYQNYNSLFVVAAEPSPRFHASKGIKISNVPAYNKEDNKALQGMKTIGIDPNEYYYIDIPKIFQYKNQFIMMYSGLLAMLLACMLKYKKVYTSGIDGTVIGYEGGYCNKKKHIKALKKYVRSGKHKKVGVFKNPKPNNVAEWSDWKVSENYMKRLNLALSYCKEKYPKTNIFKSHSLSLLNTKIRDPLYD
tara:strand:- start:75 stop:845 length:771 start_codon:yes stop_codon:yes gene_type:complete